jgi:hypothetical protein
MASARRAGRLEDQGYANADVSRRPDCAERFRHPGDKSGTHCGVSLSARLERDDVVGAQGINLIQRPIEVRHQLASRSRFQRDFVLGSLWNHEDKLTSDFDLGRCRPEIAITQIRSPHNATRGNEHDSFVINLLQTLQIKSEALDNRLPQLLPRASFSAIALP